MFIGDQSEKNTKCSNLYLESVVEVRPRQASELACVALAGKNGGLAGLRVLKEAHCRCCGTE